MPERSRCRALRSPRRQSSELPVPAAFEQVRASVLGRERDLPTLRQEVSVGRVVHDFDVEHGGQTAKALGAGIFFLGYFMFEVPSNTI